MRVRRRALALLIAAAAAAAGACGGNGGMDPADPHGDRSDELIVQVANYELVAGAESRFIAGLLTHEQLFVSFGTVDIHFTYLGTRDKPETEAGPEAQGEFLAIEGDASTTGPVATTASEGRGVYAAQVNFDRPGFWAAEISADLEDGSVKGEAKFEVLDEPVYPAVGERAPRTDNLTVDSNDASREAIDSRARDGAKLPDPQLHEMTIAESIERKQPALVVFSTPVYCVSRFCGPVTDMVAELEADYGDRTNFIHVEVWRDFENTVVNKGAAEWIYRQKDLTEPWIYLIGADGKIAARWDNVATRAEIESLLEKLPPLS